MSFKIAIIGAGSIGFTREIVKDLLCVKEFRNIEIALTDINEQNLGRAKQLLEKDFKANDIDIKLSTSLDRKTAFKDAKYVFNFVRVGMLEGFAIDIEIPMKYGVDQCVGDTLGPGGIMYGQRGIPEILDFCRDIKDYAQKSCILLNYSNPNAMITWACNKYGGIQTIGLCHGVQAGHKLIADALDIDMKELDIKCVGINHQTWFVSLKYKGKEMIGKLLEAMESNPEIMRREKVRVDMLKRFGYFSTESNGHLSEYLQWYRKRHDEIKDWIAMDSWDLGESGGYLRSCTERRNWFDTEFPEWLNGAHYKYTDENQGLEHGSHIIEALETGRIYKGHFNVVNNGVIKNLDDDAIVEVPGYVDATGVNIPVYGELPLGCAAVCAQSINVQRLSVEAAVHGDEMLLKQALMMDPLTGACLNPPEIWQMADEMLVAGEKWLPQYKEAIKAAKIRLKSDNLIKVMNYKGAARKRVKSVDELRNDKDKIKGFNKAAHENQD